MEEQRNNSNIHSDHCTGFEKQKLANVEPPHPDCLLICEDLTGAPVTASANFSCLFALAGSGARQSLSVQRNCIALHSSLCQMEFWREGISVSCSTDSQCCCSGWEHRAVGEGVCAPISHTRKLENELWLFSDGEGRLCLEEYPGVSGQDPQC